MELSEIKKCVDEDVLSLHELFELMNCHCDYISDTQYRAGFCAGWNSGITANEGALKIAQSRVGKKEDYFK